MKLHLMYCMIYINKATQIAADLSAGNMPKVDPSIALEYKCP